MRDGGDKARATQQGNVTCGKRGRDVTMTKARATEATRGEGVAR